jgi:phosphomevalonate kinase
MKNSIVIIILVVVIGMIAYWYLGQNNSSTAYLTTDVKTTDSVDAKYIYNILQQMARVNLDDSIFSNTLFQNLKDNTVSFPPQVSGRNNPFAPVGSDENTSGQTTGTGVMTPSLNIQ